MKRLLIGAVALLAACGSSDTPTAPSTSGNSGGYAAARPPAAGGLVDTLPVTQLTLARSATARYRDLANALADGYVDIDVVIPNMGRHYLKASLLDDKFEADHPELLVYSPDAQGRMALVAVEYAAPLAALATAPEGFDGSADHWSANQEFQLWTLHAWIWKNNPDGVFSMTNSLVP